MAQDTPPKDANCSEEPLFVRVWTEFHEAKEAESRLSNSVGDESDPVDSNV